MKTLTVRPVFSTEEGEQYLNHLELIEIFKNEKADVEFKDLPNLLQTEVWILKGGRFFQAHIVSLKDEVTIIPSCSELTFSSGVKMLLEFGGKTLACAGVITQIKKVDEPSEKLVEYLKEMREQRHPYEEIYKESFTQTIVYGEIEEPIVIRKKS